MSKTVKSGARRAAVLLSATTLSLFSAAAVAEAHVTVNPNTAAQGGYAKVTFRCPNEMANASTVQLEIDLPADAPVASVLVKPVPGWTATETTSPLATPLKTKKGDLTEAVSKIVWTGGKIDVGQFQEFDVSLGPLPTNTTQVIFKALQTYSDGTVVRWIDLPQAGQATPAHPAPILHLTPAAATTDAAATTSTPAPSASGPSVALAASSTSSGAKSDGTARTLGGAGLVVGVLGVATAAIALRRRPTAGS